MCAGNSGTIPPNITPVTYNCIQQVKSESCGYDKLSRLLGEIRISGWGDANSQNTVSS